MRVAIFAHYDRDGIIDDYVIYYLQALRPLCGYIIFVSDCDLADGQQVRLEGVADTIIAGRHGEYDFGSYKRGYQYAERHGLLEKASELIMANDSCYGPLLPLEDVFAVMDGRPADAWGLTINRWGLGKQANVPHIQSFFIVLRPQVFNSAIFGEFMDSVQKLDSKHSIITEYELGLSAQLLAGGFSLDSYIPQKEEIADPFYRAWREMFLRERVPLVKVSLVKKSRSWKLHRIMSQHGYPPGLAAGHKKRVKRLSLPEKIGLARHNRRMKKA